MTTDIKPWCLPFLVGSMPLADHAEAVDLTMAHTSEIPSWCQLPANPRELMIPQFAPGMPGLVEEEGITVVDAEGDRFQEELLSLYEAYLGVTDGGISPDDTPYVLTEEFAQGFFSLIRYLTNGGITPIAVKGQVVGPVTFCTGLRNRNDQAIFH